MKRPRVISAFLLLGGVLFGAGLTQVDAALSYNLAGEHETWPEAERQAIINAMDEAVAIYNQHGYFPRDLTANYNPGVPTAQASYSGWIDFGNLAYMNVRTALHEIGHTLGVGTVTAWNNNRAGNTWTGEHANRYLRHFDGPGAVLSADTQHFWPYGLNQNSEDGAINRVRHVEIVAAMRRDMGIVAVDAGVPSDWQMFHFGSVDPAAASRDFDGDGSTDLEEYLAFTDPTEPFSYSGSPPLFYHWPLNETAADPALARLDPGYEPAGGRELSAPILGAVGRDAWFVKGSAESDPGPVYGPPAAKGVAYAGGSTGSVGPGSRFAKIELGNAAPGNSPFTLSLWFYRDGSGSMEGIGDRQHIVSATEGEGGSWNLHARNVDTAQGTFDLGFFHTGLGGENQEPLLATGLASDTWYHAAIVRDEADVVTIYLDARERFSGGVGSHSTPFLGVEGPDLTGGNTVAYWRFEEGPAGARVASPQLDVVPDSSGNGNHLRTWADYTSPQYVTGRPFSVVPRTGESNGLALNFSGGNRDVYSQGKPINTYPFSELTVEVSFNPDSTNGFQVIIGKDGNPIGGQPPFALKLRPGGIVEAGIADGSGTQRLLWSRTGVSAGVWHSAAVTMTSSEMALWLKSPGDADYVLQNTCPINGLFAATADSWTVGRGMWAGGIADFFNGSIDEVRITGRAMGGERMVLGHDAGDDASRSFLGLFDDVRIFHGALRAPDIPVLMNARPQAPTGLEVLANTFSEVGVRWTSSADAVGYNVKRALTSGGPYTAIAEVTGNRFVDTGTGYGATYYYVVSCLSEFGESGPSAEASVTVGFVPHLHLSFDEGSGLTAADVTGNGWNGALYNGATWGTGQVGGAVYLNGSSQYVQLPADVVAGLSDFTIATWVRLSSASTWSRVFDFGGGTSVNMFLTPQAGGSNAVRFVMNAGSGEQRINGTSALPAGRWVHVAVTLKGNTGTLYIDGAVAGTNSAMFVSPSDLGNTTQNWIGRSQWPDPYLNGLVDEFRVIRGALSLAQVNALKSTGTLPPPPPAELTASAGASGEVDLAWQAAEGATSYTVWRASSPQGSFMLLAEGITETAFTDSTAGQDGSHHYVVAAVNAAGESHKSRKTSFSWIQPEERRAPGVAIDAGSIVVSLPSILGRTYQLQRTADLAAGDWGNVGPGVAGTGGDLELTDPIDPAARGLFYRVVITP